MCLPRSEDIHVRIFNSAIELKDKMYFGENRFDVLSYQLSQVVEISPHYCWTVVLGNKMFLQICFLVLVTCVLNMWEFSCTTFKHFCVFFFFLHGVHEMNILQRGHIFVPIHLGFSFSKLLNTFS